MVIFTTWLTLAFNLEDDGTRSNNFQPDLTTAQSSPSHAVFFQVHSILFLSQLTRLKNQKSKPIQCRFTYFWKNYGQMCLTSFLIVHYCMKWFHKKYPKHPKPKIVCSICTFISRKWNPTVITKKNPKSP